MHHSLTSATPFARFFNTRISSIIRQKTTFVHNLLFYDNDLFYTHRLSRPSVWVKNYSIRDYAHTDDYTPPSDETIFIFRNLHLAMVFRAYQDQMEYLEYPVFLDRTDPREGKVWKDK